MTPRCSVAPAVALLILLGAQLGTAGKVATSLGEVRAVPTALSQAPVRPGTDKHRGPLAQSQSHSHTQCSTIPLAEHPTTDTGLPVDEAFISYAFEFQSFARFAGNLSHPNTFTNNLLNNIGNLTGTKPRIRVGGTSADFALYDRTQTNQTGPRVDTGFTTGVKQTLTYGDVYYESFRTLPDVKYVYMFDLAVIIGGGGPTGVREGYASLNSTVPVICKALTEGPGGLLFWEFGNEPDLYDIPSNNYIARTDWTNADYVRIWKQGTAAIREQLRATPECAHLADDKLFRWTGPSLWTPGPNNTITLDGAWAAGLGQTGLVQEIAMHRYLQTNKTGNITYANTLLNHTHAITSLRDTLRPYEKIPPTNRTRLVIDETNSLSNIGIRNFTNAFAGALWNMDWALHLASQSVARVHFQQGTGFFYNSWEATDTLATKTGTKAPYYGNLAAAAAIGESKHANIRVREHNPENSPVDVAYAIYSDGRLARLAVLNLRTYFNGTRGTRTYSFTVPPGPGYSSASVKRLVGPSTDNLGGVQWDGNQFGIRPNNGLPNSPGNVTTDEKVHVRRGQISVDLDDSSAAVLEFSREHH